MRAQPEPGDALITHGHITPINLSPRTIATQVDTAIIGNLLLIEQAARLLQEPHELSRSESIRGWSGPNAHHAPPNQSGQ